MSLEVGFVCGLERKPCQTSSHQSIKVVAKFVMHEVMDMQSLEDIQEAIKRLSPDELRAFREWFWEFDFQIWDKQLEEDIAEGRLDWLAEEAINDLREGRCTEL